MLTVIIKRNEDRNYDRLFKAIDDASFLGRGQSTGEGQTDRGYEVRFKSLDADVIAWLDARAKDFELVIA